MRYLHAHLVRLQSNALFACSLCSHAEQCAICMLTLFACRAMRYLHAHFVRMQSNALQSSALHCGLRGYRRGKARALRSRAKKRQAKCLSFFCLVIITPKFLRVKMPSFFETFFETFFWPFFESLDR